MKPRRLAVSLTYQKVPEDIDEPTKESVGIDPGVKHNITAVSNDGTILQIPGFDSKPHLKVKRPLLRKMQRQRDQALKDGRARFISQKTRTGKIKRRFRWNEQPSKGYLKTLTQVRKVEQTRQDSMTGYQHRLSHQLVRDHQTICIEDTKTANMTRSAKGTAAEPGKNVKQKAGLNRSILAQGWYGLRTKDRIQSGLVRASVRCCTSSPHQPAMLRLRISRCRQPGQPSGIQVPELRIRNKRRQQRSRKYPAPRCRNLGQGRKLAWVYRRRPSRSTSATKPATSVGPTLYT